MTLDRVIVTCIDRMSMRPGRRCGLRGGLALSALLLAGCTLWTPSPQPDQPTATISIVTEPATNTPSTVPVATEPATSTPTATATVLTDCTHMVTRTPPPEAPTYGPNASGEFHDAVDPHVETCATRTSLAVGDSLTLTGIAVDFGLPVYRLIGASEGASEPITLAVVQYDNQPGPQEAGTVPGLEVTNMSGDMQRVQFELRATAPGTIDLVIGVSGEVHYGYPGPASWSAGQSEPVRIEITN